MKQLLVAALLLAATTAAADERPMSVSEVLRVAPSLHGRTITVTAIIQDGGVHQGLFLEDPADPEKRLDLSFGQQSEDVTKIREMLLDDLGLDEPLGVAADLTGTFSWRPEDVSRLSVSNIANPRWGRAGEHGRDRDAPGKLAGIAFRLRGDPHAEEWPGHPTPKRRSVR